MRLFVAIDLPEEAVALARSLARHIEGGRPVAEDNLHLTLAYLGDDVSVETAEDVHRLLEAKTLPSFEITLGEIGTFGSADPRAIWLNAGPKPALSELHSRVCQVARRAGCDLPKRRYQPHVTLARFSRGDPAATRSLAKVVSSASAKALVRFTPMACHLYQSHLGRSGPTYERLATYPLHVF